MGDRLVVLQDYTELGDVLVSLKACAIRKPVHSVLTSVLSGDLSFKAYLLFRWVAYWQRPGRK